MEKKAPPGSIDEYISAFPPDVRRKLTAIRRQIRKAAPDAVEKISYGMPAFALNGNLVYFAAHAHHIGFYPGSSRVVFGVFARELAGYARGKGSVQLPLDEPLPLDLIARIVEHRAAENRVRRR